MLIEGKKITILGDTGLTCLKYHLEEVRLDRRTVCSVVLVRVVAFTILIRTGNRA